jgi:hypothetical protein
MSEFGRDPRAGHWISRWPLSTLSVLALAVMVTLLFGAERIHVMTREQQHLLPQFLKSAVWSFVPPLEPPAPAEAIRMLNYGNYGSPRREVRHAAAYAQLAAHVFGNTLTGLFLIPALAGGAVLVVLLPFGVLRDKARRQERRTGRRLRGSEATSDASLFTQRIQGGDGFVIQQQHGEPPIILPRDLETYHTLIIGATGSGKSTLIDERLEQIAARDAPVGRPSAVRRWLRRLTHAA